MCVYQQTILVAYCRYYLKLIQMNKDRIVNQRNNGTNASIGRQTFTTKPNLCLPIKPNLLLPTNNNLHYPLHGHSLRQI